MIFHFSHAHKEGLIVWWHVGSRVSFKFQGGYLEKKPFKGRSQISQFDDGHLMNQEVSFQKSPNKNPNQTQKLINSVSFKIINPKRQHFRFLGAKCLVAICIKKKCCPRRNDLPLLKRTKSLQCEVVVSMDLDHLGENSWMCLLSFQRHRFPGPALKMMQHA